MSDYPTQFLDDVVAGLSGDSKSLPCKYFYDETGSQLFDAICELDEYYLTRTELEIIEENVAEITHQIGPEVMLVEFGSGSSLKTRLLLDNLESPAAYVPVDISHEHLNTTVEKLRAAYPEIEIIPVTADFTQGFELPKSTKKPSHNAVFFPGSTIGNFVPDQARKLLASIARIVGLDGGLIIGLDLQKDADIINDEEGITAEFNLNLLHRINRELDGDIDVDKFEHDANYQPDYGRVEISLVSLQDQNASIAGQEFEFERGEKIHTEYSHKYTIDGFASMAEPSGFKLHRYWQDEDELFAVLHLVIE